jgi:hypothetical protein
MASPPTPAPRGRGILILGAAALLVALGVGGYFVYRQWYAPLPVPGEPRYDDYVEAFEVGLANLDTGERTAEAIKSFNRAVDLVPQEPAGWANRGLAYLRSEDLKAATADLEKADRLAPDNARILALLGLLADKQGHSSKAVEYLKRAVEKDPQNLPARYQLYESIEKEGLPDGDARREQQLVACLQYQPHNLFLLVTRLRDAVLRRDTDAVRDTLGRLAPLAPAWSAAARERFAAAEKAAGGAFPPRLWGDLQQLANVIQSQRGYGRDRLAFGSPAPQEGEPLRRFLRLPPAPPAASDPDLELTFRAAPLAAHAGLPKTPWAVVLPVWMSRGVPGTVFVADAREVRRTDLDGPALSFPGGSQLRPPSEAGVVPLDWNNDFRTDLLLAGAGGLRFYQQQDRGTFADVTAETKLDEAILHDDYYGAWPADVDADGFLDIVLAPRTGPPVVLRNNADGTFAVRKPFGGVQGVRDFAWADLDNDGASDAILLDDRGGLHVFANERSGQFRRRSLPDDLGKLLALAVADVNDDGVFDLVLLRKNGAILRLSDKDKGKSWEVAELTRWREAPADQEPGAVRLLTADLDNNGSPDLIAAGSKGGRAWLSDRQGHFTELPFGLPPRVAAALDLDADGRLDLLALSADGQPVQALNRGTKAYHWQTIQALANYEKIRGDSRINSFSIGGEAEIRAGTLVAKQLIADPHIHFGLGTRQRADVLRFVWTNGATQVEFDKPADTTVAVVQRLGGSCPFLFAHDGRQVRFVKDFMWSTPLGMYINAQHPGGFTQTLEWVKIRGDQLGSRAGAYDVRVTAELWEADFFDYLSLIVVDHPPGTEVFVNEAFPLVPSKPRVHVTGPTQPVARAWDQQGRDVTDLVRDIDGRYLDTFPLGKFQGVAADHWVEVDLGDDAPRQGPVWLLAHGWLQPTDSSINVALEQGKHDHPRPLVMEVPDGKGGWRVARDDLGFPAGKNKTMLIRLDGVAGKGVARHFRLRTNMEIYWDALHYAAGLDDKLARLRPLRPDVAELRHRGFSRITRANRRSPELPDYNDLVGTGQPWRDLIGYYTRFGDVRELLEKADDRSVIANAGDEIALRFTAPPAPPAGWKRDFVWASDGWTKDGNLNTRFSKTVLPLPAHDQTSYDRPPGELEDDPVYRRFPDDWLKYHTRYIIPDVFERGLRPFRAPGD